MYTIPHQYAIATLFMVYATDNGDLNGLKFLGGATLSMRFVNYVQRNV